ncbi:hypothetical protein [Rhodococcus erythropolis]|uniref:hypothetical protein n=1 Tax=Rhodococcus erythropolis TaxID=1833 RepID=UPI0024B665B5|nr:hypothetical protein [Rhodococcus erythropolis]MDJ0015038.1 hypothetical protein [Rhodococcus erythropolis]
MWIVALGKALEIGGLALAARGLFLAWRHSADGAHLFPEWVRDLNPFPRRRSATVYATAATLSIGTASALVEVSVDPNQPLAPRVAALEANLNAARRDIFELTSELRQQAHKFEAEDKRIERTLLSALAEESRKQTGHAVIELRTAVLGLSLSAFGVLIQLPQSLGM